MGYSKRAILKTLLYSDIFQFPLTKDELWQYLLADRSISKRTFTKALHALSGYLSQKDGFYCIKGKEKIITKRKRNSGEVQKKLHIATIAATHLSRIPTVLFIGISGSLAMGNVRKVDDIDFFIITKNNTLFLTRLWILFVLEVLQLRRKRTAAYAPNRVCVNLLIEEQKLAWPKNRRDAYTAHEIIQLHPLFERENTYKKFLRKNMWVKKFYPNGILAKKEICVTGKSSSSTRLITGLLTMLPVEQIVRLVQKQSIRRHQTIEEVSNHVLAFHPYDYRSKTLTLLASKLQHYGLLTNV